MSRLLSIATCIAMLSAETGPVHIPAALLAWQTAQTSLRTKQYNDAIASFQKAIEIEPTYKEAFTGLIDANLQAGRRTDAARALTQMLEIYPEIARYRMILGNLLIEQNQYERALAQFSFILRHDPLNADALLAFAIVAKKLGMAERAADALDRGRKQYPHDDRFQAKPVQ